MVLERQRSMSWGQGSVHSSSGQLFEGLRITGPALTPALEAALIALGEELKARPIPSLRPLVESRRGAGMVEHWWMLRPGESLTTLSAHSEAQGWPALPTGFVLTLLHQLGAALAELHQRGFVHGALTLDTVWLSYAGAFELGGVTEGCVAQLSGQPLAQGPGPAGDLVSLAQLGVQLLGGEARWMSQPGVSPELRTVLQRSLGREGEPILHGSAFMHALSEIGAGGAFSAPRLQSWLATLLPARAQLWQHAQESGFPAPLLPTLFPPRAQLLPAQRPAAAAPLSPPIAASIPQPPSGGAATVAAAQPVASPAPRSAPARETAPTPAPISTPPSPDQREVAERLKKKPAPAALKRGESSVEGAFELRLDSPGAPLLFPSWLPTSLKEKIEEAERGVERWLEEKLPKKSSSGRRQLRLALLWQDTLYEERAHPLDQVALLGAGPDATLQLPEGHALPEQHRLYEPARGTEIEDGAVEISCPAGCAGWVMRAGSPQRLSGGELVSLRLGEPCLLYLSEESALLIEVSESVSVARPIPLPTFSYGLPSALLGALLFHMSLLLFSFSSERVEVRFESLDLAERFLEISANEEEAPEEPEQPPEDIQEEQAPEPVPDEVSELAPVEEVSMEEKVREQIRTWKGAAGAAAALDSLLSEQESGGGSLDAVGDALGAGAAGPGDALGDLGAFGDISMGGGAGSGALGRLGGAGASARGAGRLKGRTRSRKLRGQVKALRSRTKVTGGRLSRSAVIAAINKNQRKIQRCYERALSKGPSGGRLTLGWKVKRNGRVGNAKQIFSGLRNPSLVNCILGVVRKIKFPRPTGGDAKIKYTFVFTQR